MKPEIEEFAKTLIEFARDRSIQSNDSCLQPEMKSFATKRWRVAAGDKLPNELVRTMIPDVVDETIFHLLQAIDEGILPLLFTASNGTTVDLTSEGHGELAGWYVGADGWREAHSQERFVDNFADVHLSDQ